MSRYFILQNCFTGAPRRLNSQRAPLLPKPEPVNPSLVNFDALIQEFTGGRAAPNGKSIYH